MKNEKSAPRLVGRQFATPLSQDEIELVAGGYTVDDSVGFHPGPGTCTLNGDDD